MKKIFGYLLSGLLAVSCGYDRFGVAGRGDLEGGGTANPLWCGMG